MRASRGLPWIFLCVLATLTACATNLPQNFREVSDGITAPALRRDVAVIAGDRMQGRAPDTLGDRRARQYLINRLEEMGLTPGRPNARGGRNEQWQQRFELAKVKSALPASWSFEYESGAIFLAYGTDFVAVSGVQTPEVAIEDAELVFVGYGIEAPEFGWDDYKGQNLRGKVLVMLNNDPDWDAELFEGERRMLYGRWTYKYEMAAKHGAVGAIIIHTHKSAGYPWQVVQTSWRDERYDLPAQPGERRTQVEAWMTEDAARQMFGSAGHDYEAVLRSARSPNFSPEPLGVRTSIGFLNEVTKLESANVLGVVRGSDPELADEYVVYSAHHDHLGEGGDQEDKIYNGARDNAAGVAQALAIAEAMVKAQPKRSVLFAFVGAEESGLLGSEHFVKNPTVPPGRMVANINFDGGNIWGRTRDVVQIGLGQSTLDSIVRAGARRQKRRVAPDPFPDRGFFYRSDHFNFARVGVPTIFLRTGTQFIGRPEDWGRARIEAWEARHYHQPSDELRRSWNFEGMVEDTQLAFYCGVAIANRSTPPRWKPKAEFRAAREAALEALAAPAGGASR